MTEVKAAAIYARISSDPESTGLAVARQIADCRELATRRGWTVAEDYKEDPQSAYSGKSRPEYDRMLKDLRDGHRDAVIVYNLDRLTRRPAELEYFLDVCKAAGVTNVATVTADLDLGNDDGLFMARLYAAVAAKESGRKSARVRRKLAEVAASGMPHGGGTRPYGYENDRMTIRPGEAAVITDVARRFIAGESARSLCTWLNTNGHVGGTGKPWSTTTLRGVLAGARIAGLRAHRGVVVGAAAWPAIITQDDHRRILALLDQRKTTRRRTPRTYLLSGLLRCGRCGNVLYSAARKDARRYVCLSGPDHGGCGGLSVVAGPLENLVADLVILRLDTQELADALSGRVAADERAAAEAEALSKDRAQLEELATAFGQNLIGMQEWLAARKPIEARIEDRQRTIARASGVGALNGHVGNGQALRDQWTHLALTQRSAIVSAVLDRAVIGPGTPGAHAFNHRRVQPMWRL